MLFLSTSSYLDLVVDFHGSRIISVISGGMFGCLKDALINELPAVSFLDKVNVSDLDWMVNDIWWKIYREILEKWDHHWKPKLCAPPGSNHDPRRMALLDFRNAGPYQSKWRESIKFCISPLNTKCIHCKCLMIWIPWNIFWSLLLR